MENAARAAKKLWGSIGMERFSPAPPRKQGKLCGRDTTSPNFVLKQRLDHFLPQKMASNVETAGGHSVKIHVMKAAWGAAGFNGSGKGWRLVPQFIADAACPRRHAALSSVAHFSFTPCGLPPPFAGGNFPATASICLFTATQPNKPKNHENHQ